MPAPTFSRLLPKPPLPPPSTSASSASSSHVTQPPARTAAAAVPFPLSNRTVRHPSAMAAPAPVRGAPRPVAAPRAETSDDEDEEEEDEEEVVGQGGDDDGEGAPVAPPAAVEMEDAQAAQEEETEAHGAHFVAEGEEGAEEEEEVGQGQGGAGTGEAMDADTCAVDGGEEGDAPAAYVPVETLAEYEDGAGDDTMPAQAEAEAEEEEEYEAGREDGEGDGGGEMEGDEPPFGGYHASPEVASAAQKTSGLLAHAKDAASATSAVLSAAAANATAGEELERRLAEALANLVLQALGPAHLVTDALVDALRVAESELKLADAILDVEA
jgi:hypothetical protein